LLFLFLFAFTPSSRNSSRAEPSLKEFDGEALMENFSEDCLKSFLIESELFRPQIALSSHSFQLENFLFFSNFHRVAIATPKISFRFGNYLR
jgi:hypothetical protein